MNGVNIVSRAGDDDCNIGDLYQFGDKTGVLSSHEQCLAQLYEDSAKSVTNIEGYQELRNKLEKFNKKHDGVNLPVIGDVNINKKIANLEKRVEILAADNKILSESSASFESTNKVLFNEIANLKDKMMQVEDGKYSQLHMNTHKIDSCFARGTCPVMDNPIGPPFI